MSLLKQVLAQFEDPTRSITLTQVARTLDVDMGTLQGMVDYWVRKGKLRECSQCEATPVCSCCGPKVCPFIVSMPKSYERVWETEQ